MRRKQRTIETASEQANQNFDRLVLGRWRNLQGVRRFVVGWLVLVALLITGVLIQNGQLNAYYQADGPAPGGTFREGLVGDLTNVNPIFSTSGADRAASKLLFSNLLKYNDRGVLTGDLASNWTSNKAGNVYVLSIKPNAVWHDGTPITANDVVFTYETVQHPDARSYLNSSWRGVKVEAKSDKIVTFTLPNAFAPFLHSLTLGGIIPEHILGDVDPARLRSHPFNTSEPIGSGPFVYEDIFESGGQKQLRTNANVLYYDGPPKLDKFVIQTFADHDEMIAAFKGGELSGVAGVRTIDRDEITEDARATWYDLPLESGVYAFFKNTDNLLKDEAIRLALTQGTNNRAIVRELEDRYLSVNGPLLSSQLGYAENAEQYGYNPTKARQALNKAGWESVNGVRTKNGKELVLTMVTQNSDDYPLVAQALQKQWGQLGIKLRVNLVSESDIQQNHILPHNYQILLFGITIGKDPDVFPYWHSSQRSAGGFNLSEFNSPISDIALETGRTRLQPQLRQAKYQSFMRDWRSKVPAVGLYQPGYGYVQHSRVSGFVPVRITTADDRFNGVHDWQINTQRTDKTF